MNNEDVLKLVGRKYPTCSVLDCQGEGPEVVMKKCECPSKDILVGNTKNNPGWIVSVCTGHFNVYVLSVTDAPKE